MILTVSYKLVPLILQKFNYKKISISWWMTSIFVLFLSIYTFYSISCAFTVERTSTVTTCFSSSFSSMSVTFVILFYISIQHFFSHILNFLLDQWIALLQSLQFFINKNTLVELLKASSFTNEFSSGFRNDHIYIGEDPIRRKIRILCKKSQDETFKDLFCHEDKI